MLRRAIGPSRAQRNPAARQRSSSQKAAAIDRKHTARNRGSRWLWGALGIALFLLLAAWIVRAVTDSPARLMNQAEAASRSGDWPAALRYWRSVNATSAARSVTYLEEARACLVLGRATQAERSLRQAIAAGTSDPEPWRLLLEILRVEDRITEVQHLGWQGYDQIRTGERPALLRELTLALLVELPDELVRTTLHRWIAADDADLDAQVALLQHIATQPRAGDPDRASLLAALETIVTNHPAHIGAREAFASALADAGEADRGRDVLEAWPQSGRDARYWRLHGRWQLEYDHQPDQAVVALQATVAELPQDWRSWYRLARSLHTLGRGRQSMQAAETTSRIREVLDPLTLGPRLAAAFEHIDKPAACFELAAICDRAGSSRLATAWRALAGAIEQQSLPSKP